MDGMYAGFAGAKTGHGRAAFGRGLVLCLIRHLELAAFTPLGGRHQSPVLAIGGKYTVETGENVANCSQESLAYRLL